MTLNLTTSPDDPAADMHLFGKVSGNAFGLIPGVVTDEDEAAVEFPLAPFHPTLTARPNDINAEVPERPVGRIDQQEVTIADVRFHRLSHGDFQNQIAGIRLESGS